jgi:hypothetical protein
MAILFESNTNTPTEFIYEGETITNFGQVLITDEQLEVPDEAPSL